MVPLQHPCGIQQDVFIDAKQGCSLRACPAVEREPMRSTVFSMVNPIWSCSGWCPIHPSSLLLDVCLCIVIAGAFPPHGAKAADSSLPLHPDILIWTTKLRFFSFPWAGKIIWGGEKQQQGISRDFKLLFSHSVPSIKSCDFAPQCCQTDDGCLWALFTHWNINTVCRESGSRINKECVETPRPPVENLLQGLNLLQI